jgi:histidinol-phosphatase (PHP family)
MPRTKEEDLYPEEVSNLLVSCLTHKKHLTPKDLDVTFYKYYQKAVALREKYASQIRILIGFETEYIRPESVKDVQRLWHMYNFDFCVGSIHHVLGISIDYNTELWQKAQQACGGTDELLYSKYFDEQHDLLTHIKPLVIGHFDVIRLWAPDKMVKFSQWPSVWEKVLRNIDTVISYGGVFELNSAAFRKGFPEAYPTSEIASVRSFTSLTLTYPGHC